MSKKHISPYKQIREEQLRKRIGDILEANGMHYDYTVDADGYVEITVDDGDWKHDHIALKTIMRNNGFVCLDRHTSDDETGDDSYSAVYLFR